MEIRENRVHPDHTEHTGTENNDKIFFHSESSSCIAEWKSADCVDILLGYFAVWNGYVFFFVIVCQIFLQIVSDGSRTDIAGVSARSDCFFYQTTFIHKNLRLKRHLKKITSRVQIASHTVCTSVFKFFLYLITKPPFHLY